MQLVSNDEQRQIEAFLHREARLADESRYEAWEALVDDDMYYWVPTGDSDGDEEGRLRISITADNRQRLATRIAQLKTGMRHSQLPVSPMRRVLSNIEIETIEEPVKSSTREYRVGANFVLYELRAQSTHKMETWPGRVEYKLRVGDDGEFKMFFKKVMLVHGSEPLSTLGFII
jgi:3-phenylpropionate/cinnamic acid dioxygenase small subunit